MPTHRIRLNGPWIYESFTAADEPVSGLPPGTVSIPATWHSLFGTRAGTARFRRSFHRPTNLDPHESVWIAAEDVAGPARLTLNGEPLGVCPARAAARFDVTAALRLYNDLTVEIACEAAPPPNSPLWTQIAIEIDSTPRS